MILKYFNGSIELNETLIYAAAISVIASISGILHHPFYFYSVKYGLQVRLACSGLIYRKVLHCGITSFESTSSGDINNLLAVDLTRIETAIMYVCYLAIGIYFSSSLLNMYTLTIIYLIGQQVLFRQ